MRLINGLLFSVLVIASSSCSPKVESNIEIGTIVHSGEVTDTTAIVQIRLSKGYGLIDTDLYGDGDALRDGILPGYAAEVYFQYVGPGYISHVHKDQSTGVLEVTTDDSKIQKTGLIKANSSNDYIARAKLTGLKPNSRYIVTPYIKLPNGEFEQGPVFIFETLPGATISETIRFHAVTCMNYDKFYGNDGGRGFAGEGRDQGYPAAVTMADLGPDFVIYMGDGVYYDKKPKVKTLEDMRSKWHRQFMQPNMQHLNMRAPGYWMKDDHDHRTNDSDATGNYFPSHELGIKTFREQVPIFGQGDDESPTYRTHRVSKDLQIWLLEGRDYRSPNKLADGPGKTLWGKEQLAWLKRTLLESDATYRLIISPTPLVGPDDGYKRDNHTNPKGFRHEGDAFKRWAAKHGLWESGAFLLCGDRHWQYHSIDPSGAHEFSSGAICDANSRIGRKPGDPKSTDPEALIKQPYSQTQASGGFLSVVCEPGNGDAKATIRFEFYDEHGEKQYQYQSGQD